MSRDLTPRQWEIVALMAEGLNQQAIAQRLGISRNTLRAHLYSSFGGVGLYERVGAANDVQVVIWYYQRGQYQRPNWDARKDDATVG